MNDDATVQAMLAIRKQRIDSAHHALRRLRDGISPHPLADVEEAAVLLNDAHAALAQAERERDAAVAALDRNSAACGPLATALRTILSSPFSDGTWDGLIEDALYEMAKALLPPADDA